MELCEGGELSDVLREKQTFCEKDTKVIMTKMAKATSYLHKRGIYRNVCKNNIMVFIGYPNMSQKN